MKDNEEISNEWHELETVAKKFNIPVWQVMKAKEELKTNNRKDIYKHLSDKEKAENYTEFWQKIIEPITEEQAANLPENIEDLLKKYKK